MDRHNKNYSWQKPTQLERSWFPGFFSPEFIELDELLSTNSSDYIVLSDVVFLGQATNVDREFIQNADWIACPDGIKEIKNRTDQVEKLINKGRAILLDNEAIIIHKFSRFESPRIYYWSKELFPEIGIVDPEYFLVLQQKDESSIAWLFNELKNNTFLLQYKRLGVGSIFPLISSKDFLDIKISKVSENEKERQNKQVIELIRNQQALERATYQLSTEKEKIPSFIITGATFEERKAQFERYLLELPVIDSGTVFYIESSTPDKVSDLFMVRPIVENNAPRPFKLIPQADREVNKLWREWYQDTSREQRYRIYNSFVTSHELPSFLLAKMIDFSGQQKSLNILQKGTVPSYLYKGILPNYSFYRNIVEPFTLSREFEIDTINFELLRGWITLRERTGASEKNIGLDRVQSTYDEVIRHLQTSPSQSEDQNLDPMSPSGTNVVSEDISLEFKNAFETIHSIYRPLLAIKILREDKVAGVYLLSLKAAHVEAHEEIVTSLQGLGARLSETLEQTSKVLDEAARSESLRRLSTVMHQINGPLGRIKQVIEDIEGFLDCNIDISNMLVPTEKQAEDRSEMTDEPLENFTFKARFSDLVRATDSIRNLAYQIRRLKTVHGELKFKEFDLRELISKCLDEVRGQLSNLRFDPYLIGEKVICYIDYETVYFSLVEILNNSCRELKENNIENPAIEIYLDIDGTNASITIQDNALPVNQSLIERPFDEGSTKYRGGKGSGLGLTVVRDTFKRHHGSCELVENREENGERKPGVTFKARIPLLEKEIRVEDTQ